MKTIYLILAALVFVSCDGGECGQAGPDECWPGPGKCWFEETGDGAYSGWVFCDDSCGCASAEYDGSHSRQVSVRLPFVHDCVPSSHIGAYDCDEDCNCVYPEEGDGEIIDLPR